MSLLCRCSTFRAGCDGVYHLEAHLEVVKRVLFQIQRDDSVMMHDDDGDDDIVVDVVPTALLSPTNLY
jgi:hypothetical protein